MQLLRKFRWCLVTFADVQTHRGKATPEEDFGLSTRFAGYSSSNEYLRGRKWKFHPRFHRLYGDIHRLTVDSSLDQIVLGWENEELQPLNYFEAEATHLKDKKSRRKRSISESSLLDELRAVSSFKKIAVVFFVILIFVLAHVASHRANEVKNGMNIYLSFTPAKQASYFGSDLIECGKQGNAGGNPNPDPQSAKYIFDLNWQKAHFRLQDAQGQVVESLGDLGEGSSNIGTCWVTLSFTKLRDFAAPIYLVDDNGLKFELNAVQLADKNIEIVGDGLHL